MITTSGIIVANQRSTDLFSIRVASCNRRARHAVYSTSITLINYGAKVLRRFYSTQNGSCRRRSSQPISWLATEETKLNTTEASNIGIESSKLTQNTKNTNPKY